MSTGNKTLRNAPTQLARTKFNIDKVGSSNPPVIEKIDVATFEIDESIGASCDPYNNTGQFMVDAIKRKYED